MNTPRPDECPVCAGTFVHRPAPGTWWCGGCGTLAIALGDWGWTFRAPKTVDPEDDDDDSAEEERDLTHDN